MSQPHSARPMRSASIARHAAAVLLATATIWGAQAPAFAASELVTMCMFDTDVRGSYVYRDTSATPTVRPGPGGSVAGAAAMNSCIARQAAAGTVAAAPATGRTYRVSRPVAERVETTRGAQALAAVPATPIKRSPRRSAIFVGGGQYIMSPKLYDPQSGLPVPGDISGYPLQPGDAALWRTLDAAQKQRALAFLSDGSSIRSSLKED